MEASHKRVLRKSSDLLLGIKTKKEEVMVTTEVWAGLWAGTLPELLVNTDNN